MTLTLCQFIVINFASTISAKFLTTQKRVCTIVDYDDMISPDTVGLKCIFVSITMFYLNTV